MKDVSPWEDLRLCYKRKQEQASEPQSAPQPSLVTFQGKGAQSYKGESGKCRGIFPHPDAPPSSAAPEQPPTLQMGMMWGLGGVHNSHVTDTLQLIKHFQVFLVTQACKTIYGMLSGSKALSNLGWNSHIQVFSHKDLKDHWDMGL